MFVEPADRPRLPDIKQSKQDKTCNQCFNSDRDGDHCDQKSGNFIPHNATVVVNTQLPGSCVADPDTRQHCQQRYGDIQRIRQSTEHYAQHNTGHCACGARCHWSQAGSKTQRQETRRRAQQVLSRKPNRCVFFQRISIGIDRIYS